jgi:hypothetical protein
MNAERSAGWVRSWVALYTRGLPADVRHDRSDEIESDLWSQLAESAESRQRDEGVGKEILARLLLGVPADITWRLDQRSGAPAPVPAVGRPTAYARNVAISGAVGGVVWAIWIVPAIVQAENAWVGVPGILTMISLLVGAFGLSLATFGLVLGNIDRLHGIASMLGAIGAGFGLLITGGVFWGFVLLPVGSAAVMWNLARLGVVSSRLARVHAGPGVLFAIAAVLLLGNLIPPGSASPILYPLLGIGFEIYTLSWVAIGWSLRAGTWMPEEPAAT